MFDQLQVLGSTYGLQLARMVLLATEETGCSIVSLTALKCPAGQV